MLPGPEGRWLAGGGRRAGGRCVGMPAVGQPQRDAGDGQHRPERHRALPVQPLQQGRRAGGRQRRAAHDHAHVQAHQQVDAVREAGLDVAGNERLHDADAQACGHAGAHQPQRFMRGQLGQCRSRRERQADGHAAPITQAIDQATGHGDQAHGHHRQAGEPADLFETHAVAGTDGIGEQADHGQHRAQVEADQQKGQHRDQPGTRSCR